VVSWLEAQLYGEKFITGEQIMEGRKWGEGEGDIRSSKKFIVHSPTEKQFFDEVLQPRSKPINLADDYRTHRQASDKQHSGD
jgi:hypothetical protein